MTEPRTFPQRVFSGVQPSGALHLGNYLGALRKFARLQSTHECVYCIVDLHAITVWQDPARLADQTREIAAAYLASGVDPERAVIYAQSGVPAHAELAWYLNCTARMGWLNRMTQFKDKAGKNSEKMSVGLFDYPVLQAADILAFRATHVPVGEDQKQHLELSRDIAAKFNHDYGREVFPLPEPLIDDPGGSAAGARVMSLRDGTKKMSKSDPSDASRINLSDTSEQIARKIRKAKTDPAPITDDPSDLDDRPEVRNLVGLYSAFSGEGTQAVLDRFAGQGFGVFKPALAELVVEHLSPVTEAFSRYLADPAEIDRILSHGRDRARAISEPVLAEVRDTIGFLQP